MANPKKTNENTTTTNTAKGFWSSIPKTNTYENLKDWENAVLRVVSVTDFVGEYSECFVLNGYDTDIPFDDETEPKLHQVLVSKGYNGRDIVCTKIREFLAQADDDAYIDVTVRKHGKFFAVEEPNQ